MDQYLALFESDLNKILIPAIFGLVGWIFKNYIFDQWKSRDAALKAEWEKRLTKVWSPLYYWSGIILMGPNSEKWDKHGLKQVEEILAASAHLIPPNHYFHLIRLIELNTTLPSQKITHTEILETRKYIYKQIEILNFVLYKRSLIYDPQQYTNTLNIYSHFIKLVSQLLIHIMAWIFISLYGYGIFYGIKTNYWISFILILPIVILISRDIYKRFQLAEQVATLQNH